MLADRRGPWTAEAVDLVRAASGGLLFGIPLLYTMEVWWTGSHTSGGQAVAVLAVAFILVLLLNRTTGFRSAKDVRWRDAMADAVEAVALSLLLVTVVLVLLREVTGDTPIDLAVGKVVYEATPFAIGVGVAHHLLRQGRDDPDHPETHEQSGGINSSVADIGATVVGSIFVAFNIAPTDEIPMLASAMGPPWLLAVMAASLLVSYAIVFVAGFVGERRRHSQEGVLQHPLTETVAAYLIALVTSGAMLWFFQRLEGPWSQDLSHVVVLGLPAAVGGAAGRLAI